MNFVRFTDTEIVATDPMGGDFKGNQNDGFTFVMFRDGSGGIQKRLKEWTGNKTGRVYPAPLLAANEYLAARVGKAMDAPIRDCLFVGSTGAEIIMPYLDGKSGKDLDKDEYYPDGPQGGLLRLFDFLVANSDRRPKNLMYVDGGIVGIDHALCNFRRKPLNNHTVAELWNHGCSAQGLRSLREPLGALADTFAEIGFQEQHANMLANLEDLIWAFDGLDRMVVVEKGGPGSGDIAGHEFHGNQWDGGKSLYDKAQELSVRAKLADTPEEHHACAENHKAIAAAYKAQLDKVNARAKVYANRDQYAAKYAHLAAERDALSVAVHNNLMAAQAQTDLANDVEKGHYPMQTNSTWGNTPPIPAWGATEASTMCARSAEFVMKVQSPAMVGKAREILKAVVKSVWAIAKGGIGSGAIDGHPFEGNQWGFGSGLSSEAQPRKWASDIVDRLNNGERPNIAPHELGTLLGKVAQGKVPDAATADITNLRINGTDLLGHNGLGYPRSEMPQIPQAMRPQFVADLQESQGITSTKELVDPTTLQPSQSEIGVARAAELYAKADGEIPQDKFLLISQDNYVIDGHHNWVADVAMHINDPSQMLPVIRVNAPAQTVITQSLAWSTAHGIDAKVLGKSVVEKGDVPGHPFHGNQWQGGAGTMAHVRQVGRMLYNRAARNAPEITREVQETVGQFGGTQLKQEFMLKTPESIDSKLVRDAAEYLDTARGQIDDAAANVSDALRYTIQFPEDKFCDGVQKSLDDFKTEGFDVVRVKNFFNNDPQNTYRGINAVLHDTTTNQLFEVQFHTPDSAAMVDSVHPMYQTSRMMDPSAPETVAARAQMASMWATVPNPPGVEAIGTPRVKKAIMKAGWTYYQLMSASDSPLAYFRYDGVTPMYWSGATWGPSKVLLEHLDDGDPMLEQIENDPIAKGGPGSGPQDGHPFYGNGRTGAATFKSAFDNAFKDSPYSAFVNHYTAAEIEAEHMKPILSADGKTGLLVHDHGDGRIEATALFSTSDVPGAGLELLKGAIDNEGVNYVECFGPVLPVLYGTVGFKVDTTSSFDPQYAPSNWDSARFDSPDYVTMRIPK